MSFIKISWDKARESNFGSVKTTNPETAGTVLRSKEGEKSQGTEEEEKQHGRFKTASPSVDTSEEEDNVEENVSESSCAELFYVIPHRMHTSKHKELDKHKNTSEERWQEENQRRPYMSEENNDESPQVRVDSAEEKGCSSKIPDDVTTRNNNESYKFASSNDIATDESIPPQKSLNGSEEGVQGNAGRNGNFQQSLDVDNSGSFAEKIQAQIMSRMVYLEEDSGHVTELVTI